MPRSKVHLRGPTKPELNVTPLIDVTFLLIIFFMVISNFITEESVQMIVPELQDPKVRPFEQMSRIVVNIAPRPYTGADRAPDYLEWSGDAQYVKIGSRVLGMDQMADVTAMLSDAVNSAPKDEDGQTLLEVLLRADSALHFQSVQPVMEAITGAGIAKVHLVSYLPDKGPTHQAPSGGGS